MKNQPTQHLEVFSAVEIMNIKINCILFPNVPNLVAVTSIIFLLFYSHPLTLDNRYQFQNESGWQGCRMISESFH